MNKIAGQSDFRINNLFTINLLFIDDLISHMMYNIYRNKEIPCIDFKGVVKYEKHYTYSLQWNRI